MIRRLRASHFRSLGKDVTVDFCPLTALVGQNGAGKSNVIDALVFLSDCMHLGLEGAVTKRGGIQAVRYSKTSGRAFDVTLQVEIEQDGTQGGYEITLTGDSVEEYRVKREKGFVKPVDGDQVAFHAENGKWLTSPPDLQPRLEPTGLVLPLLGGDSRFSVLANALRSIAGYSIFPDALRMPQRYDPKRPMDPHGANWLSILKDQSEATWKSDLVSALHKLTGDVVDVKFERASGFLVMQFKHDEESPKAKQRQWFDAGLESDGTLRVAGIITALLQEPRPHLIAIEEPELTVHPGALRLLVDFLRQASLSGQVVITSHSPDLLSLLSADEVRIVERVAHKTSVAPLDETQRKAVLDGLFTLGEMMRVEGLRPQQLTFPELETP